MSVSTKRLSSIVIRLSNATIAHAFWNSSEEYGVLISSGHGNGLLRSKRDKRISAAYLGWVWDGNRQIDLSGVIMAPKLGRNYKASFAGI
jgi:hypothetical protein